MTPSPIFLLLLQANVLTLEQAEQRARKQQPTLIEADEAAVAAGARAVQARAPLLPQVTAAASYREGTGNRTFRLGTDPIFLNQNPPLYPAANHRKFDYLTTSLTLSQLLYDFGQSSNSWRASRELAAAAGLDRQATAVAVLLDVRMAFIAARARKELVQVARDNFANRQRHLDQVRGFIDVKLRPPIDLAQARTDLGAAELRVILAENDYAIAKADLGRAMGEASEGDFDLASDDIPPVPDEGDAPDELARRADQHRPDLASLDHRILADERAASGVRGAYWPTLHLTLAMTDAGPFAVPAPFHDANLRWNYYGTLNATWTLFEGLRTKGRVQEASAILGQDQARRALAGLTARMEVGRARGTVSTAKAAIRVAEGTAAVARERLSLAEERYRAGVGTALEVSDAQLGDVTAAADLVQARFGLGAARAQLFAALGREH